MPRPFMDKATTYGNDFQRRQHIEQAAFEEIVKRVAEESGAMVVMGTAS